MNKNHENTPYEICHGKRPNISHFQVFGFKYFFNNNGKTHHTAFDAKSNAGIAKLIESIIIKL